MRARAIAGVCLLSGSALALPPVWGMEALPAASALSPPSTSLTAMANDEFEAAMILDQDSDLSSPIPSPAATTSCEDGCFVVYLAACAVCKKLRLGSPCYAEAMEEYVRCAKRCREGGH